MKTLRMLLIALALCVPAFAWNCTTAGQVRVQVPTGTKGTGTGDGSGQVVVDSGLTFICETLPVATTQPPSATNTNSNSNSNNNSSASNSNSNSASNSNSNSSASANQKQQQKQAQSQVANGGNARSSSTAAGGNAIATGNGNNSNDSVTNIAAPKIPVNSAITPPILPTVPCFKGFGGAAQTAAFGASFGGGKIDKGCNARELARSFSGPQTVASCKILTATKEAIAAGITMADCLPAPVKVYPRDEPTNTGVPALVAPAHTITIPIAEFDTLLHDATLPRLPSGYIGVLPSGELQERHRTVTPTVTKKAVQRKRHMTPACQNGLELRCVAPTVKPKKDSHEAGTEG